MINTVSLQTAKKLKEAGFKQDKATYFWMVNPRPLSERTDSEIEAFFTTEEESRNFPNERCAALSTDELLEEITTKNLLQYYTKRLPDGETIGDLEILLDDIVSLFRDPNKLADCWLYLNAEGLLKGKE